MSLSLVLFSFTTMCLSWISFYLPQLVYLWIHVLSPLEKSRLLFPWIHIPFPPSFLFFSSRTVFRLILDPLIVSSISVNVSFIFHFLVCLNCPLAGAAFSFSCSQVPSQMVILRRSAPSRPCWGHLVPWKKPQGDLQAASPSYVLHVAPQVKAPSFHLGVGTRVQVLPEQLCPPRPPGGGRLPVPLTGQPLALGQPCGGQRFSSWSFSHETQVGVGTPPACYPSPTPASIGSDNHSTAFFLKEKEILSWPPFILF